MNGNRDHQYNSQFISGKGTTEAQFRHSRLLKTLEDTITFKYREKGLEKPVRSKLQYITFDLLNHFNKIVEESMKGE